MMTQKVFLFISLSLLFVASSHASALEDLKKETLKGIKSLSVVVEDLSMEVERGGLKRDQIQADVELRLRKHGIKVTSSSKPSSEPGAPYLYIKVGTLKLKDLSAYAVGISVELRQNVSLIRAPKTTILSATWWKGATGEVGANNLRDVREAVIDYVDIFANDFLSVNQ